MGNERLDVFFTTQMFDIEFCFQKVQAGIKVLCHLAGDQIEKAGMDLGYSPNLKLPHEWVTRETLAKFVSQSSSFDNYILAAIFLNSIAIASVDYRYIDDNYQPSADLSVRNNLIDKAEIIFTVIFLIECMIKCTVFGLWRGDRAYIRDGWIILDFFILIVR